MTRGDLVVMLKDTANSMSVTADYLHFYGRSFEAVQHASELLAASEMVVQWANELEKDDNWKPLSGATANAENEANLIANDVARCAGDESSCCKDCARRLQMRLDKCSYNRLGNLWYINVAPTNGTCVFKIVAQGDVSEADK